MQGEVVDSSLWDPMKEVQQMVGTVQGQHGEKLVLLEPIGKGGFGTVYRGRWRNLDVAVKVSESSIFKALHAYVHHHTRCTASTMCFYHKFTQRF